MNIRALSLAAAIVVAPVAAHADTLIFNDFQNFGQGGWTGPANAVGTSEYQGNVSLRIVGGANATLVMSTQGYKDVNLAVAFAALDLGAHGGCALEASIDDGADWIRVFRIGTSDADGVKLHKGNSTLKELADQQKVTLRLINTGPNTANCWADNIIVTGTPTGGPRAAAIVQQPVAAPAAAAPAKSGAIVWDPNSVK